MAKNAKAIHLSVCPARGSFVPQYEEPFFPWENFKRLSDGLGPTAYCCHISFHFFTSRFRLGLGEGRFFSSWDVQPQRPFSPQGSQDFQIFRKKNLLFRNLRVSKNYLEFFLIIFYFVKFFRFFGKNKIEIWIFI